MPATIKHYYEDVLKAQVSLGGICPEAFGWGPWSDAIGSLSPCFLDVTCYSIFVLGFFVVGSMFLWQLLLMHQNQSILLPRKSYWFRLKQALITANIILRTVDLFTGITGGMPGYFEIHCFLDIWAWAFAWVLLTMERSRNLFGLHHISLRYFFGLSACYQAIALREAIMLSRHHIIYSTARVAMYGIFLTISFAMGVLTVILRETPDPSRDYSEIKMHEGSEDEYVWIPEKPIPKHLQPREVAEDEAWLDDITWELVLRILHFGLPELWLLLFATVMVLFGTAIGMCNTMVNAMMLNGILDCKTVAKGMQVLDEYIEFSIMMAVIGHFMEAIGLAITTIVGERIACRLRNVVYSAILTQDIPYFDTVGTGELINRIIVDTGMIAGVIMNNMSSWILPILRGVIAFIAVFVLQWRLTLISLSLVPASIAMSYISGKVDQLLTQRDLDALAKNTEITEEGISAAKCIRSFGTESLECKKFEMSLYVSYDVCILKAIVDGCIGQYNLLITHGGGLIATWYGGRLIVNGKFSFGFLMAYFQFQGMAIGSLGDIFGIFPEFASAVGASKRIFAILDRERSVRYSGGAVIPRKELKGHIVFKDVRFAYPANPAQIVLKGISMDIKPGETHALVGPSGGGKTTTLNLIQAIHHTSAGSLTMDGYEINELDPLWYRRSLGYVAQQPILFNNTLRHNLSYGTLCTDEQVEAAAKDAFVMEFLGDKNMFPDGMDTEIGVAGGMLSGGQKQRIAIARAILRNPQVLLLDEATSALDSKSEEYVQKALEILMKGRTSVVIAHRLTTVVNADCIHVIEAGRVTEEGTHNELMALGGAYNSLATKQMMQNSHQASQGDATQMSPLDAILKTDMLEKMSKEQLQSLMQDVLGNLSQMLQHMNQVFSPENGAPPMAIEQYQRLLQPTTELGGLANRAASMVAESG